MEQSRHEIVALLDGRLQNALYEHFEALMLLDMYHQGDRLGFLNTAAAEAGTRSSRCTRYSRWRGEKGVGERPLVGSPHLGWICGGCGCLKP